jgi:hypothetical protein
VKGIAENRQPLIFGEIYESEHNAIGHDQSIRATAANVYQGHERNKPMSNAHE